MFDWEEAMSGRGFCRTCLGCIRVAKTYFEEEGWCNQKSFADWAVEMSVAETVLDNCYYCFAGRIEWPGLAAAASGAQALAFVKTALLAPLALPATPVQAQPTCAP